MSGVKTKVVTEVYSRVSGYFRPVNQWNNGKREEFAERKFCDGNAGRLRGRVNPRSDLII